IIAGQEATSTFIAKKLFEFFVYTSPSNATINKFAQVYLSSNYSIKEVMRAILNSDEFYSSKAYNALIKSPTESVIGTVRQLKAKLSNYSRDLVPFFSQQGQVLFNPPSVKGWDGDLTWINTATLLSRCNFGNALSSNRSARSTSIDPKALLAGSNATTTGQVV